ncbi:heparan-alpha-glucosaminide N-acetyltransferase domain-containing protein [Georgenia sp. Z1491]|uniref:heparan-alpha-glucosaminide N-acetyltransferase domain-containing protein n=1 Tax=Georgenia sp. Z1491 TaxID=3416707 RepID=UPI003CEF799C
MSQTPGAHTPATSPAGTPLAAASAWPYPGASSPAPAGGPTTDPYAGSPWSPPSDRPTSNQGPATSYPGTAVSNGAPSQVGPRPPWSAAHRSEAPPFAGSPPGTTADADAPPNGPAAPRSTARLVGLDLARGIAVLGMVTAHVGHTTDDLSTLSGWLAFAHGRSSILFCLLAGVSLGILTGGRTPYTGLRALQSRTRILVRAVLLLAIAAALAMLDTFVALILGFYAVWFMFSLPFHRWRARRLLVTGGVWLVVSAVGMPYLFTVLEGAGMVTDSWGANGAVLDAMFGLYPGLVWYGLVLVGMGVARLDMRSWKILLILLGAGILSAGVGYGGGALLRDAASDSVSFAGETADDPYPGEQSSVQFGWTGSNPPAVIDTEIGSTGMPEGSTSDEPWHVPGIPGLSFDSNLVWPSSTDHYASEAHSASVVEMLGSGGVALAILAACLLLPRLVHVALLPIRAIGTMSLTAYSAHVVAIDWWPETFATHSESNRALAILAGGLAVGCLAWYLTLGRGPLERLMHGLSVRAARTDAGPGSRVPGSGSAGPDAPAPTSTPTPAPAFTPEPAPTPAAIHGHPPDTRRP